MSYSFEFLPAEPLEVARVKKIISRFEQVAPTGWSCCAFSNHDVVRLASRWSNHVDDRDAYLKMLVVLILRLRGSACLYQGEELGLTEGSIAYHDLKDPYGIQFWPDFKGRDGCCAPMV